MATAEAVQREAIEGWRAGLDGLQRELPTEFGPWQTIYRQYRDWCATGAWPRLLQALSDSAPPQAEVSL